MKNIWIFRIYHCIHDINSIVFFKTHFKKYRSKGNSFQAPCVLYNIIWVWLLQMPICSWVDLKKNNFLILVLVSLLSISVSCSVHISCPFVCHYSWYNLMLPESDYRINFLCLVFVSTYKALVKISHKFVVSLRTEKIQDNVLLFWLSWNNIELHGT